MKIAFLILAHAHPQQLARLCARLQPHDIFVHLDTRADQGAFAAALHGIDVTFTRRRHRISWAGYSMVEATLDLISEALASRRQSLRLVLLSGSCYPVRPVAELAHQFESDGRLSYISATRISRDDRHLRTLIERHWFHDGILPARLADSSPRLDRAIGRVASRLSVWLPRDVERSLGSLKPCFGSQWWALTPACARYVVDHIGKFPALASFYKTVHAPDEHVIQTLVANSAFRLSNPNPAGTAGPETNRDAPLHWIHPSDRREFSDLDTLEGIRESGKYFIRKLSVEGSDQLVRAIDSQLLGVARVA